MNPLTNAETGMLYTTDSKFLAKVKYTQTPTSFTFIFSSKPDYELPKKVYLMPGENLDDYTSFLCSTTDVYTEYYVPQTDRTWFLTETTDCDLLAYRSEFRIDVCFPLDIVPQGSSKNKNVTVVDISVGGMKFIADTEFEVGKTFSFIFAKGRIPVFITAQILKRRPARRPDVYCYGCRFLNLDPQVESALRGVIFKENLIQTKSHKQV